MKFPSLAGLNSAFIAVVFLMTSTEILEASEYASDSTLEPHIVVLIADDLGVDHAPCHSSDVRMPFLERQCSSSIVFQNVYAHPLCAPSRASMLTGRHPFRTNVFYVEQSKKKLSLDEITLPEFIRANSTGQYRFAAFGKWHLADDENGGRNNPNLQGFDLFSGTPRQHHTYSYYDYSWYINGNKIDKPEKYRTTHIVDVVAADFKAHHESSPQLYWVGFTSPHLPFHLPPTELHSFQDLEPRTFKPTRQYPAPDGEHTFHVRNAEIDPYFFAMLEALDTEIGRLSDTLSNMSRRPIVFLFLGDNGTSGEVYKHSVPSSKNKMGIYRAKGSLYEGGTRIPLMIWAKGVPESKFKPQFNSELVHLVDIFPTLSALAGVQEEDIYPREPVIDGKKIALFQGDNIAASPRDFLYIARGNDASAFGAVDSAGYKLILRRVGEITPAYIDSNPIVEIYDTPSDPFEMKNLANSPCELDVGRVLALYDFIAAKFNSEPGHQRDFDEGFYRAYIRREIVQAGEKNCKTDAE